MFSRDRLFVRSYHLKRRVHQHELPGRILRAGRAAPDARWRL
jgi:hypothetical protein